MLGTAGCRSGHRQRWQEGRRIVTESSLTVAVDRSSPVPLYYQLAQCWEQAIESGQLPDGLRLDNEIALAEQLGLSRPTVRRALQHLVERGLLVRRRGVGTQVVRPRVRRPIELTSLFDDLTKANQTPSTDVLSFEVEQAAGRIAHALAVPEGTEVYSIERLRYSEGQPLALMRNHVPVQIVELTADLLRERGLYQILRARGIVPRIASQTIGARVARGREAKILAESRGAPLLTMVRTAHDEMGRAVEYGDHVYRASLYSFELTLTSG
jgi:DNA-binding GntR family transcriptional regulator